MYTINCLSELEKNIKEDFPGVTEFVIRDYNALRAFENMPYEVAELIGEVKDHLIERLDGWVKTAHYGHDGTPRDYDSWIFVVRTLDNTGWQNFVVAYFL